MGTKRKLLEQLEEEFGDLGKRARDILQGCKTKDDVVQIDLAELLDRPNVGQGTVRIIAKIQRQLRGQP